MATRNPRVLVGRLYAQEVGASHHTAKYLAIVRAYMFDDEGRMVGQVPARDFLGSKSEHQSQSGVLLRARGTLYALFSRPQASDVVAVITERLRSAGYADITFVDPAGSTLIESDLTAQARRSHDHYGLAG